MTAAVRETDYSIHGEGEPADELLEVLADLLIDMAEREASEDE